MKRGMRRGNGASLGSRGGNNSRSHPTREFIVLLPALPVHLPPRILPLNKTTLSNLRQWRYVVKGQTKARIVEQRKSHPKFFLTSVAALSWQAVRFVCIALIWGAFGSPLFAQAVG